jgi:hypothetical protein
MTQTATRRKLAYGSVLLDPEGSRVAAVKVTYASELSQILVYLTDDPEIASPAVAATWEAS